MDPAGGGGGGGGGGVDWLAVAGGLAPQVPRDQGGGELILQCLELILQCSELVLVCSELIFIVCLELFLQWCTLVGTGQMSSFFFTLLDPG
jgi:hypothetical protein